MQREAEFLAEVISLGRVTIPSKVRKALRIRKGDILRMRIVEQIKRSEVNERGEEAED